MMLHTKYQDSRPCGFRQVFFMFPYISLCKTFDPPGGGGGGGGGLTPGALFEQTW